MDQIVPDEGERGEQTGADRDGSEEEAPAHVVDDDDQRIDAGRRMKVRVRCIATMARPTAQRPPKANGPATCTTIRPTKVEMRWPPISARGCAGSASGEPITSTIEVANGTNISGKAARSDNHSISRDGDGAAGGAGDHDGEARPAQRSSS